MGTRHYAARADILVNTSAECRRSFSHSLLLRTAVHHVFDPKVQHTILPNLNNAFDYSLELPPLENLICFLQDCIGKKILANAWKLYMLILANGLECSKLVDHLVPMFVKCQRVSHMLSCNTVQVCTYLIHTLVNWGKSEQALSIFERSDFSNTCPDKYMYQPLLKACGTIQCAHNGQVLHCHIVKKGFDLDSFVGSTLLDMYAKNGMLEEAQVVFDELLIKDVVCWSALICGYAENGYGAKAIQSFSIMLEEGVIPNDVTFMCGLKACGLTGDIDKGREVYAALAKEGYEKDLYVASALVSMYMDCGWFEEAQEVFDELPFKDIFLWTTLIGAYAERGHGREALTYLEKMQAESFIPNAVTSVGGLKACGSLKSSLEGRRLHIDVIKKGFDDDNFVITALLYMYMNCGLLTEARNVFNNLPVKSLVFWNALIAGFVDHGCGQEALDSFEKMRLEGVSPDAITLACSIKACIISRLVKKGQSLHMEIVRDGFEKNAFVGISLLDMYRKHGLVEEAQVVFDGLPARDVVSWNTLIMGYAENGFGEEALSSLSRMFEEGVPMDAITAVCILKCCVTLGESNKGRWVHMQVVKQALFEEDPIVGSALIDMYAKCISLLEAHKVFDSLESQDVVSWGTLLLAYTCQGEGELVFCSFDEMQECGIHPDGVSLLSILTVCSHTGLLEKGFKALNASSKEYDIPPTLEHYNCLIDLLGRAGQLDEAGAMLNEMPFQPNFVTWITLLGSCLKCGDIRFAKQASECAAVLTINKGDLLILMWKCIAENHIWQDTEQFELFRR